MLYVPYSMTCGPERIRTADLLDANEALYQLSYGPARNGLFDTKFN